MSMLGAKPGKDFTSWPAFAAFDLFQSFTDGGANSWEISVTFVNRNYSGTQPIRPR